MTLQLNNKINATYANGTIQVGYCAAAALLTVLTVTRVEGALCLPRHGGGNSDSDSGATFDANRHVLARSGLVSNEHSLFLILNIDRCVLLLSFNGLNLNQILPCVLVSLFPLFLSSICYRTYTIALSGSSWSRSRRNVWCKTSTRY